MQITVPTNLGANPLYITIGGVRYALGAGETIDVPDAVYAEMLRMQANKPLPLAPDPVLPFEDADLKAAVAALEARVAALEAVPKELPDVPETDGTYGLQLVVDDDEGTLTWEAAASAETEPATET